MFKPLLSETLHGAMIQKGQPAEKLFIDFSAKKINNMEGGSENLLLQHPYLFLTYNR